MDKSLWKWNGHSYDYIDPVFNTIETFSQHVICTKKLDKNSEMLFFAKNMQEYFKKNNEYPKISFDEYFAKKEKAIEDHKQEINPEYLFMNECNEKDAFDRLLDLIEFKQKAEGQKWSTNEIKRFIFESTIDWTRGMYGC